MKQMMAMVAVAVVLSLAYAVNADQTAGKSALTTDITSAGANATHYVNYPRGNGKNNGMQGTITAVGSRGFLLTMGENKVLKILVDANTKFIEGGKEVDPSNIKEGIKVGVTGSTLSADEMLAITVTIEGEANKRK